MLLLFQSFFFFLILFLSFPFSGEFVVVNKHLLHDLTEMGLWSPAVKNKIIIDNGSVQNIQDIPEELKAIYKYVLNGSVSFL